MKLVLGLLAVLAALLVGLYAYSHTLEPNVRTIEQEAVSPSDVRRPDGVGESGGAQ